MTNELEGRVALVSGGGRGIGKSIAEALHAHGAAVIVADNGAGIDGMRADPEIARAVVKSLGARAVAFTESIASPSAALAAVGLATKQFGAIDILVNNAAILRDAFIFKGEPGSWDAVLRNNLSAAYYLMAAATPLMREAAKIGRGGGVWGRIVNIVSSAGIYGNYGQASYASAKGGLIALSRVAALDLARSGITSNAIAPFAATRVTDAIKPANDAQALYKARALKISARHVANLVNYLCLPAAQKITGQLFGVRGREIFLFSQPRPVASLASPDADWTAETLTAEMEREFRSKFTELSTDLEAFNTEPLV
ncbi:MAG TPA: SDR family NAD(P)-dependent oxidoreductase [Alphaproteobacteria bacterium]|nr:SDR family NAD(P)-dependent oxidoreductase [Alphaproteobacteria bacterium]